MEAPADPQVSAGQGDKRSSGLQNWQAEAPVTGCQFIGHHLVSQDGQIRPAGGVWGGCVWWISAGNSTSTGTHIQLPHGVAVTCSVHQKTLTNPRYLQVRWGHVHAGFGDLCDLGQKRNKGKTVTLGRTSLVTRQFPPPCFIARSKRHHCSHSNSLAKGPRPV